MLLWGRGRAWVAGSSCTAPVGQDARVRALQPGLRHVFASKLLAGLSVELRFTFTFVECRCAGHLLSAGAFRGTGCGWSRETVAGRRCQGGALRAGAPRRAVRRSASRWRVGHVDGLSGGSGQAWQRLQPGLRPGGRLQGGPAAGSRYCCHYGHRSHGRTFLLSFVDVFAHACYIVA